MSDVTRILDTIHQGDVKAVEQLLPLVYSELHRLAAAKMACEPPGHTLQPTALVHEAWLRLGGDAQPDWENRGHFFKAASEAMRRILVDNARRKHREKRGGRIELKPFDTAVLNEPAEAPSEEIVSVNEALDRLASEDTALAEIVKLRYFVGLPMPEVAEVLQTSLRTANRRWVIARVRLKELIRGELD